MKSYVYIIQAGDKKNAPIKVGVSDDPEKRLKQLQTGNPKVLRLLMSFECKNKEHAFNLEKTLHLMLSGQGILNEWFSCSRTKVTRALNKISNNPEVDFVKNHDGMFSEAKSRARTRKEEKLRDSQERKILALKNKLSKTRNKPDNYVYELAMARLKESRSKLERAILRSLLNDFGVNASDIKDIYKSKLGSRRQFMIDNCEKVLLSIDSQVNKDDFISKFLDN